MGILSKIGKAVKKVFKGVAKVFKKVTKFVGRAMQSKWGKALMVAATVFTMGAAAGAWGGLSAGASAAGGTAANAGGFFSKFVSGAKSFLGIGQQTAATAAAGGAAAGAGTAGQVGISASQLAAASSAPAAATAAVAPATAAGTAAQGATGLMAKAGTAALNFLKSPGGAQLAGSVMSGYAQGKQAEEMAKEEERRARYYDEQWRDPGRVGQLLDAARSSIETPMGFMNRARRVTQYLDQRASQFPTAPGNPQDVAQMAVGG